MFSAQSQGELHQNINVRWCENCFTCTRVNLMCVWLVLLLLKIVNVSFVFTGDVRLFLQNTVAVSLNREVKGEILSLEKNRLKF